MSCCSSPAILRCDSRTEGSRTRFSGGPQLFGHYRYRERVRMMVPHESGRDSWPRDQGTRKERRKQPLQASKGRNQSGRQHHRWGRWTSGLADWWPHNWVSFSLLAAARKTAKTVAWKWWSAQVDEIPQGHMRAGGVLGDRQLRALDHWVGTPIRRPIGMSGRMVSGGKLGAAVQGTSATQ